MTEQSSRKDSKINPNYIQKWIKANDQLIIKLKEDYTQIRNSNAAEPSKVEKILNEIKNYPIFVCILQIKYFTDNNYDPSAILKQCHILQESNLEYFKKLNFDPNFQPLHLTKNPKKSLFVVYCISHIRARGYKLRYLPRSRKKKQKEKKSDQNQEEDSPMEFEFEEPQELTNDSNIVLIDDINIMDIFVQEEGTNIELMETDQNEDDIQIYEQYDPNFYLNVENIFYKNLKTWPEIDSIYRLKKEDVLSGNKLLLNDIFFTKINTDVRKSKIILYKEFKLDLLMEILTKITKFHRRASIYSTFKSCIKHWIGRHDTKRNIKEMKKLKRNKRKRKMDSQKDSNPSILNDISSEMVTPVEVEVEIEKDSNSDNNPNKSKEKESSLELEISASSIKNNSTFNYSKKQRKSLVLNKIKENIPHNVLFSSISNFLHMSGAKALLGTKKNEKGFMKFVQKSIFTASIRSTFLLKDLMENLQVDSVPWLSFTKNESLKLCIFTKAVFWLYKYLLNLLMSSFYITESSNSRLQASFFLKETWSSIKDKMIQNLKNENVLKKTTVDNSSSIISGKIRFLPKANNTLRTLLTLNKTRKAELIMNMAEKNNFRAILPYISSKYAPHGTMGNITALQEKWKNFLKIWRMNNFPKLYFVKADIKDAFPSVKKEKLLEIFNSKCMQEIVTKENVIKYWDSLKIKNKPITSSYSLNVETILEKLKLLITKHVVKIGQNYFTFDYGLPQGWAFSAFLCNIYYGEMEAKYLKEFFKNNGEFAVRNIDDYLFVTPNLEKAKKFYEKILKGNSSYDFYINKDKVVTNIFSPENTSWVNYFGWKFNLRTGHIARDFSSYEGQNICSSIKFSLIQKTKNEIVFLTREQFISNRLKFISSIRICPIILDGAINCKDMILQNIFKGGLMLGYRFYALCVLSYPKLDVLLDFELARTLSQCIYRAALIFKKSVLTSFQKIGFCETFYNCKGCGDLIFTGYKKYPEKYFPNSFLEDGLEILIIIYSAVITKLKIHSNFCQNIIFHLKKSRDTFSSKFNKYDLKYLSDKIDKLKIPAEFSLFK